MLLILPGLVEQKQNFLPCEVEEEEQSEAQERAGRVFPPFFERAANFQHIHIICIRKRLWDAHFFLRTHLQI